MPLVLAAAGGCLPGTPLTREIEAHARPILSLDPQANWTAHFNHLVELAPASLAYLVEDERLQRPAAPDDLDLLLRMSLVRLLAGPAKPALTMTCLETTLSVLHFDPRVGGQRLGEVVIFEGVRPRAWHEVFPVEFKHELAAAIDLEADRRAIRAWWAQRPMAGRGGARPLTPNPDWLWPLLERRRADMWLFEPVLEARHCADGGGSLLKGVATVDYNLVRAACIWLGQSTDEGIEARLIELVGSRSDIVAYNARFALRHSPDERLRRVIEQHERAPRRRTPQFLVRGEPEAAPWSGVIQ